MTASDGTASRLIAARVLDAVLHRGRSLKGEFAKALPTLEDTRDRALVEAICFAALRERTRYAAALDAWLAKPLGGRDNPVRALLYVGFAQIDALGLPSHAAVDATVEAARALGRTHQAGMVNALLRRALREGLPKADPSSNWPAWLLAEVRADWPAQADAILEASAGAAPLWLRVNRQATTRDAYRERLREAGIDADVDDALPDALRVAGSMAVMDLPGFADGDVSVQDGAAQAVADALALASGARVLDACAAPGGKAAHLLERDPSLRLIALDVDARRLRRTEETLRRVGADGDVVLKAVDATDLGKWWDGTPLDAVLIDAPCSATGIVRRQPDILLHRKPEDIATLVETQAWLLDALWPVLAPGGVLLYATCSILRRENAAQVDAFLARTPDAVAESLPETFGHADGQGRQRLPGDGGMDGFFYARLRKRAS
ncbi:MAG: 16S rRNA (cytosine(967)-C(5))-methyltransferase RsmB [Xanthomonadaceae bacterium]|nr:16S rRNA (cytosine(967)-C(5))-methyltransferase RsmB [Xanthomonadaceae bacterium]